MRIRPRGRFAGWTRLFAGLIAAVLIIGLAPMPAAAQAPVVTVAGIVTDETGPVVGATVTMATVGPVPASMTATTTANGTFVFTVDTATANSATFTVTLSGHDSLQRTIDFDANKGTSLFLPFGFAPTGHVVISVTDEFGQSVPEGVPFLLVSECPQIDADPYWPARCPAAGLTSSVTTDANGQIIVDTAGGYIFPAGCDASLDGDSYANSQAGEKGYLWSEVQNAKVYPVVLPVTPGAATAATVKVKPLGKANINVQDEGGPAPYPNFAVLDSLGAAYGYQAYPQGSQQFSLFTNSAHLLVWSGDRVDGSGHPIQSAPFCPVKFVPVAPANWDAPASDVTVSLTSGSPAQISGAVTTNGSTPLAGSLVCLTMVTPPVGGELGLHSGRYIYRYETATDGTFTFDNLPPSGDITYEVSASKAGGYPWTTIGGIVVGAGEVTPPLDIIIPQDTVGPTWSNSDVPSFSGVGRTAVTASWPEAFAQGAQVHHYEISIDNGVTWESTELARSYRLTGLTAGQSYTVKVRALDVCENASEQVLSAAVSTLPPYAPLSDVDLVSVSADGSPANQPSGNVYELEPAIRCAVSSDGRYVVFASDADNLVPNDTNGVTDVFLFDRTTRQISILSVSALDKRQGNDASDYPTISADGRVVAFRSFADNLVPGDINGKEDIFVLDLSADTLSIVSRTPGGSSSSGLSRNPSLSADGRYVVFSSTATDLAPAAYFGGCDNVFWHDRQTNQMVLVSRIAGGSPGNGSSVDPVVSADGAWVAYRSSATNLAGDDAEGNNDVYVSGLTGVGGLATLASTVCVSNRTPNDAAYTCDHPAISQDGRYVAFSTNEPLTNTDTDADHAEYDVYVWDRSAAEGQGSLTLLAQPAGAAHTSGNEQPAIWSTPTGYVIAFKSSMPLLPADTNDSADVYLYDSSTGTTRLVSHNPLAAGSQTSAFPAIGGDRFVAFLSAAGDLVPNDMNNCVDVFACDLAWVRPNPVTGLTVSNPGTGTTLSISWNAVPGITTYRVWSCGTETGGYGRIAEVNATSYVDIGLTANVEQWYTITAVSPVAANLESQRCIAVRGIPATSTPPIVPPVVPPVVPPIEVNPSDGIRGSAPTTGTQLTSSTGDMSLVVPGGLGDQPIDFTVVGLSTSESSGLLANAAPPAGFSALSSVISFSAVTEQDGQQISVHSFPRPVTFTLTLTPEELARISDPAKVGLYRLNADGTLTFVGGRLVGNKLVVEMHSFSQYLAGEFGATFTDIADHWAKADIELMAARWVVRGDGNGLFDPNGKVTRAQFAVMLARAMLLPAATTKPNFSDVTPQDYFCGELAAAVEAGLIKGNDDGTFRPNDLITREQLAVMITRALRASGKVQTGASSASVLSPFADLGQVSAWALDELTVAVEQGIVSGTSTTTLAPLANASRAEAAVMVRRFWSK